MTKRVDREVSQFRFVWGDQDFRQVGAAFSLVEKKFIRHECWPYVDPWWRIGISSRDITPFLVGELRRALRIS